MKKFYHGSIWKKEMWNNEHFLIKYHQMLCWIQTVVSKSFFLFWIKNEYLEKSGGNSFINVLSQFTELDDIAQKILNIYKFFQRPNLIFLVDLII